MSVGTDIAKDVLRGIKSSGVAVTVTITRTTPGVYDTATGTNSPGTVVAQDAYTIVSPASGSTVQAFDIRFESGTLIETNLRSLMIPAHMLAFSPGPGDVVTNLEGSTWTIIGSTPQSVGGVNAYFEVVVKR